MGIIKKNEIKWTADQINSMLQAAIKRVQSKDANIKCKSIGEGSIVIESSKWHIQFGIHGIHGSGHWVRVNTEDTYGNYICGGWFWEDKETKAAIEQAWHLCYPITIGKEEEKQREEAMSLADRTMNKMFPEIADNIFEDAIFKPDRSDK